MPKQSFSSGQTLLSSQMNDLQTNDFNQTVSTKTDDYTFVVGDRGTRVVANKSSAIEFTVDDSIFSAGDTLGVHNINTGLLTLTAGSGVTINGADVLTVAQYQGGTIFFTSASSAIFFPTAKTVSTSLTQSSATVATDQSTNSLSFTDLATVGPAVTLTTGTKVLVIYGCSMSNGNQEFSRVDFAISGATTRSATSTTNGQARIFASANVRFMAATIVTVTAGSNTFTMKYAVGGNASDFANRELMVISLN